MLRCTIFDVAQHDKAPYTGSMFIRLMMLRFRPTPP